MIVIYIEVVEIFFIFFIWGVKSLFITSYVLKTFLKSYKNIKT